MWLGGTGFQLARSRSSGSVTTTTLPPSPGNTKCSLFRHWRSPRSDLAARGERSGGASGGPHAGLELTLPVEPINGNAPP